MKTLKDHTLIYDKDCPMCCAYTSAFVKTGVLDNKGREPFKHALFPNNPQFNAHKAKNEIALLNRKTGEVKYGIDSMFTVMEHAAPVLKPLFRFKPFKWFMKKVYSFISYNRKVIAPPPKNPTDIQCTPDVNLKYRWMYIIFAVLMAGVLSGIGVGSMYKLEEGLGFALMVTVIVILRLILQALVARGLDDKTKTLDYLGNLVTVNMQLAVLVCLAFISARIPNIEGALATAILLIASIYAIAIHLKRLKSLGMTPFLCLAWNLQWALIVGITALLWG